MNIQVVFLAVAALAVLALQLNGLHLARVSDYRYITVIIFIALMIGGRWIGFLLPRQNMLSSRMVLNAPAALVWEVVSDYAHKAEWYKGVVRMERLNDTDGCPVWRSYLNNDSYMDTAILEAAAPHLLRTKAVGGKTPDGRSLPFQYQSNVRLADVGEGRTQITLTSVKSDLTPGVRFVSWASGLGKKAQRQYLSKVRDRVEQLAAQKGITKTAC